MNATANQTVTVETIVNAPIEKVWELWNSPEHITRWNSPSEDWHSPRSENDLRTGGKFNTRMEAKDGSFGFDFEGIYDDVREHDLIAYTLGDGRKVFVKFSQKGNSTAISEKFEAESLNSIEMQQSGWQAILDNFKAYAEKTNI